MATETPEYEVLEHGDGLELRRYAGYLTANVRVRARDHAAAMSIGFEPLADYIFGNNRASDRISMTAPVTAGRACCQRIPMAAPVTARHDEDEFVVSFTMPSAYTLETLPRPNNEAVTIEEVPAHLSAVVRFGGHFSEPRADEEIARLRAWIDERGLTSLGEPVAAQYDAPWKPGFARRNEIMIAVERGGR
jgi:hypothetical protein